MNEKNNQKLLNKKYDYYKNFCAKNKEILDLKILSYLLAQYTEIIMLIIDKFFYQFFFDFTIDFLLGKKVNSKIK